jgi:ankyrin repeat protein
LFYSQKSSFPNFQRLENTLLFLREGADPNAQNKTGSTALHFCSWLPNLGIAQALLAFFQRIESCPMVRVARDDRWSDPDGWGTDEILAFVNRECGTERAADGLLSDEAGTRPAADELVRQFIG